MPIDPAKLDRRITIERRELINPPENGQRERWVFQRKIWAQKADRGSRMFYLAEVENAEVTTVFTTRYLPDLDASRHRIVYRDQTYRINAQLEGGRRDTSIFHAVKIERPAS